MVNNVRQSLLHSCGCFVLSLAALVASVYPLVHVVKSCCNVRWDARKYLVNQSIGSAGCGYSVNSVSIVCGWCVDTLSREEEASRKDERDAEKGQERQLS